MTSHGNIANTINRNTKIVLLLTFTFVSSYAIGFVIFPYSYWIASFGTTISEIIIIALINVVFCGIVLAISLYIDKMLNKRIPWTDQPLKRLFTQTLLQIIGILLLIICCGIANYLFGNPVNTKPSPVTLRQGFYIVIAVIVWALMVSALNTGDFLLTNWKIATLKAADFEIKAAQNKQLAAEIELQALKLQLDPHFVFNNLSALSELILKDQQLGYEYTENFAKAYRYLLVNAKRKLITLREELKFLDAYLFLINNRMGGGTVFEVNIDESQLERMIAPVSLQLLIENALQHNRREENNPLVIKIYSNNENELVVSNIMLPLVNKANSTGIGLKNIISRYALIGDQQPSIHQTAETFTVKIPLVK
ncbi:histidine kinase [Mucilaginibacter sabulilitoris]|uniref:Histidine kinase n=1 Tax=Mucilaginibacter sabulilitoris TaxID=1173583 RepID=A0ABZ0THT9_9SPHI|nr:histidine kinase [Mucilaginibacter sabulilitoris]WPU91748.1 histidine kinase [Mucilaginibacter sabulilitoris]